jgi:N-acetylglucosaminyl-diphospho-decaprenol L-rhamnosyltransferase
VARVGSARAGHVTLVAVELSYCVINTDQRQLLRYCLDAIARERATVPFESEVIGLDNASRDGSAEAARAHPATTEVIALEARRGRAANDAALLERARGRFCLLLGEDCELEPGATAALHGALAGEQRAGAACATLVDPAGTPQPSAWRLPAPPLPWLAHHLAARNGRRGVRRVAWCRLAAVLVRREAVARAAAVDAGLDAQAAELDFCRRLRRAGWRLLFVPEARAVLHGAIR